MESKTCAKCGEHKPADDFHKHAANTTGLTPYCKICAAILNRERYQRDRVQRLEQARWYSIKRHYGLSKEQYLELLASQDHRCIICGKHQDDCKYNLSVDHNHQTGAIRGLACTYCNHRIIGSHKDATLLRRVADYLEQETGLFVPDKFKTGPKKVRRRKTPRKERKPRGSKT